MDIGEENIFRAAEAQKHTFLSSVDRYIANVLPRKPKSIKKQTSQLLWWKEQIGNRLLSDVTTPLIVKIRDKFINGITYRGKGKRSPATINRYLSYYYPTLFPSLLTNSNG